MASSEEPRRRQRRQAVRETQGVELPFGRKNYILFGAAAVVILAGYVALSQGSITLAPILLLLGYLVLIPWGILAK